MFIKKDKKTFKKVLTFRSKVCNIIGVAKR